MALSDLFKKKKRIASQSQQEAEQEFDERFVDENDTEYIESRKRDQAVLAQKIYSGYQEMTVSNEWYRNIFPKTVYLTIIVTGLLFFSLMVNVMLYVSEPEPRYFASTPDFRIKELVPLDQPLVTQGGLVDWLTKTIGDSLSINFLDWRRQLMDIRPAFTDDGFEEFVAALDNSQLLDLIKKKRLSSQIMITKTPVIVGKGVIPGIERMAWKIEFGIKMMLESSNGREYEQEMQATVVVQRANTMLKPSGLEIRQFVLE